MLVDEFINLSTTLAVRFVSASLHLNSQYITSYLRQSTGSFYLRHIFDAVHLLLSLCEHKGVIRCVILCVKVLEYIFVCAPVNAERILFDFNLV